MGERRWCARPGCRHAPSRHPGGGACRCGCSGWVDRWPHWWRRLVVETWSTADAAWWDAAEQAGYGYSTETAEWAATHPRPTLKGTMIDLAGGTTP